MERIAVFGSTGSTGTQTLEVVGNNGDIRVTAPAAGRNIEKLEEQVREFKPKLVCVWEEAKVEELALTVWDMDVRVVNGMDGLIEAATGAEAGIVVTTIVGMIGIRPTIAAMKAGRDIALANKETLVTASHIIMPLAKGKNMRTLPVDSEHSAIFQCLDGENHRQIVKILLTASGGPFRGRTREEIREVRPEDALKYPNWAMGRKITIDSSTMINRGLEVMEARWLLDVTMDQVQVVVQPKSVIHSMVEFLDGAVMAQLGTPDMKLSIQYALYYPERWDLPGERLDFWKIGQTTFEKPDFENFKGISLAYETGRIGGSMPTVFNTANEYAVSLLLSRKIGYLTITDMIEEAMRMHQVIANPTVKQILETEARTYGVLAELESR